MPSQRGFAISKTVSLRDHCRTFLTICGLLLLGCSRKTPEPESRPEPRATVAAQIEDASFRHAAAERVVAIGDLHGDLRATRAALRLAGALGDDGHWSGGKLVVVQTGDQLDRGDDEPDILDLLDRLAEEARAAGGALHVLNGNHEVMNVQGDFRYVTADGFRDFASTQPDATHQHEVAALSPEQRGRASAFLTGGSFSKRLAKRPAVIQVGDSVFVHGGLLDEHVRYGIGRINREIQAWMQAPRASRPPASATDPNGPLWLRTYSDGTPSSEDCAKLAELLARLSAKRLVMGHTIQQQGINSACDGKAWRIDVGMSRAYGNAPGVLEIAGESTRVIASSDRAQ
jgi:hypothetical protein